MVDELPNSDDPSRSLYDPEETSEEDLWFLPGDPEDRAPTDLPLPSSKRRLRIERDEWIAAEGELGRNLADAASSLGRLDERFRHTPAAQRRLAIQSAGAALEMQGDWLPSEELALYLAFRTGAGEQGHTLSQADWSIRRLLGDLDPRGDLNGYLGRHATDHDGLIDLDLFGEPARGDEFQDLSRRWLETVDGLSDFWAHPLTRAGAAFHLWRMAGISEPGAVIEAYTLAADLSTDTCKSLSFAPASLGSRSDLLMGGSAKERLKGWYKAVMDGCARALLELERLETWKKRANDETSDLSGRTPVLIIEQMMTQTLMSAEMLSASTGASKAAVRRNMATLEERGLVREVTGQGRYRFWTVSV